jgi:hypothetical protein
VVALVILLGGMGWIAARHWNEPSRHAVSLQVRLAPEVCRTGGELTLFVDDADARTVWTFRGRLSGPVHDFEPLLVPGRYQLNAQWRWDGEKEAFVHVQFRVPGPIVKIPIPTN